MVDVKYVVTEWEAMTNGLSSLRGMNSQSTFGGAFKELKEVSKLLQQAKATIRELDCDNDITFVHEDYRNEYDTLLSKFDTLGSFRAGGIVDETIDQPFFSDLDLFAGALHNAQIEKIGVPNLLGLVEPVLPSLIPNPQNMAITQDYEPEQQEKKLVSLKDLFEAGDAYWGSKVKEEYEEYVDKNGDNKSLEMYIKENLLKSRDFKYKSIKDNQELIELLADVGSLYGTGTAHALGEVQSALQKKDVFSGKDLTDKEAKGKLYMALLNLIPGYGLFKRAAKGGKVSKATLNGSLKEARVLKVKGSKIYNKSGELKKAKSAYKSETLTKHLFSMPRWTEKFGVSKAVDELKSLIQKVSKAEVSAAKGVKGKEGAKLKENQHLNINKGDAAQPMPAPKDVQVKESQLKGVNLTDNNVHATVKQQQAKTQHPSNKKGYNGNEVKEVEAPKVKEQYHQQTADGEQVRVDLNPPVIKNNGTKGTGKDKGVSETNLRNIDDFIDGNKKFDEVIEDFAKVYKERVDLNKPWSWDDTIPGGDSLSSAQKRKIKEIAIEKEHIPEIKVTQADGMRYGFADFASAGVVEETVQLPERFWKLKDKKQFKWLDEQIGGTRKGMTWHHTEVPGKMELVPFGIHNITLHNGGRTKGMWADAPR